MYSKVFQNDWECVFGLSPGLGESEGGERPRLWVLAVDEPDDGVNIHKHFQAIFKDFFNSQYSKVNKIIKWTFFK